MCVFFVSRSLHAQQLETTKLDLFDPDETDAFIYSIIIILEHVKVNLDTDSILADMRSIDSAKKYLWKKTNVMDFFAILRAY